MSTNDALRERIAGAIAGDAEYPSASDYAAADRVLALLPVPVLEMLLVTCTASDGSAWRERYDAHERYQAVAARRSLARSGFADARVVPLYRMPEPLK